MPCPPAHRKTLQLSRQLKDQAVEAQACYSLGNTYTLLQDYERAAEYHLRHLLIAQELADRCVWTGEGSRSPCGRSRGPRPCSAANHRLTLSRATRSDPWRKLMGGLHPRCPVHRPFEPPTFT